MWRRISRRAEKVVSVELDKRLPPVLAETLAGYDNFSLIEGDVMKLDLAAVAAERFAGLRPVLCANLPYNITTPFLTACVHAGCFEQLTVLIQKEVAQRICARPGTGDYGAFTLLMQYYTEPELLFTVPNTCFMPPPKVTSAVVRCVTRRKTLVNSLQTGWQLPKERLTEIVTACGLSPTVRGEALGLEEYARLADALAEEA